MSNISTRGLSTLVIVFLSIIFLGISPAQAENNSSVVVGYKDGHIERHSIQNAAGYFQAMYTFASDPNVDFIEPERIYTQTAIPNDTLWASQLTLPNISADNAWDHETGSSAVTVAILDSGIDTDHEDLINNIIAGWDFVDNDADANPEGHPSSLAPHHGTIIAGIVGAQGNNGKGIAGINWDVQLMPIRVLDETGSGNSYDVTKGIEFAMNNGADIINLSFIGDTPSTAIMKAIQAARNRGVVVIAAAGNNNLNLNTSPRYPVCHIGVIGVAALKASNVKSYFSNYGSNCVDVSAPGEGIYSTHVPGLTKSGSYSGGWAGTSFAAPHVAGVAALAIANDPDIKREQLEELLTDVAYTSIAAENGSMTQHLGVGKTSAVKAVSISSPPIVDGTTVLTFPLSQGGPHLRGFDKNENNYLNSFLENGTYHGGGTIASADIDADGTEEIIYGLGEGTSSRIRIFSNTGVFEKEFLAFSSPQNGIRVAGGDTDGDGADEILAVRVQGATSDIRIFDSNGNIKKRFFSYPQHFVGGMTIAAGDVTGDGIDEIIIGTGDSGLPRVQVFTEDGVKLHEFFAYGLGFRGGINVAVGDVDGDSVDEIITAPLRHGGPHVKVFEKDGTFLGDFFAYGEGFHGGVSLSTGDINGDGRDDIITGARQGGGPHVRVWGDVHGNSRIMDFFAYGEGFHGGVDVLGFTAVE